ncbi:MAG: hypothetical protein IIZ99_00190 [Turicibacter sp.]|nr:hypothetical protein [Turicibacter sp.]
MAKEIKDRKRAFIELVAKGIKPYRACIEAGYSEQYAKVYSGKLLEKYKNEIAELKPIVQEAIKEEFKYTALDAFRSFQKIQELALLPDEKGHYNNLNAAAKCEENKAKLFGAYEIDNEQKRPDTLSINVVTKKED